MASHNTWTEHFPGNLMWSNATLVCKGMAPYGAVSLGEIELVCARLRERVGVREQQHAQVVHRDRVSARDDVGRGDVGRRVAQVDAT